MLTAIEVSTEGTFSTGAPSPLFQTHGRASISASDLFTCDVARDAKRFLVNRYVRPDHVQPLTVVLNATTDNETVIAGHQIYGEWWKRIFRRPSVCAAFCPRAIPR
jgi:hypothetical protein